ncbi:MAG: hypothetical protein Q9212_005904 [Teloschistes hypoglaucus]
MQKKPFQDPSRSIPCPQLYTSTQASSSSCSRIDSPVSDALIHTQRSLAAADLAFLAAVARGIASVLAADGRMAVEIFSAVAPAKVPHQHSSLALAPPNSTLPFPPSEIAQRACVRVVKVTAVVCPATGDMFGKVRRWIGAVDLFIQRAVGRVQENRRRAVDAWRWQSGSCGKCKGRAAEISREAVRCAKEGLRQLTDGNPSRDLIVECTELIELYGCPPRVRVGSEVRGRVGTLATEHARK